LALFSTVDLRLLTAGVRALKQLFPALFAFAVLCAFAAVELATWPTARLSTFDLDRQFRAMKAKRVALSGVNHKEIVLAIDGRNQQQYAKIVLPGPQKVPLAQVPQRYESPFVMDARAQIDGVVSADRALHNIDYASARARSKGSGVLSVPEESANIKERRN
jgi:hypothetical protein